MLCKSLFEIKILKTLSLHHVIMISLTGYNLTGCLIQTLVRWYQGGLLGDPRLFWKSFLVPTKFGHTSLSITISQETSVQLHDVGSQHGTEPQSDFHQLSFFPQEQSKKKHGGNIEQ